MIDMHIHTTFSDGQYTPEEIVDMVQKIGIKIFSVTDHDTYRGTLVAKKYAKERNIDFVPGVEISTQTGKTEIHVLGYNVDFSCREFQKFDKIQHDRRNEQKELYLDYLKKLGLQITMEDVMKFVKGDICGRPHFAMALVEKGYCENVMQAFKSYLGTPEIKKIMLKKAETVDAIEVIKKSGGTAVLAHPVLITISMRNFDRLLPNLIEAGLDGMECYYSKNTPEESEYFRKVADKYRLLHTGGSDYHGKKIKPDVELGTGVNGSLNFTEYDYIKEKFKI